MLDHTTLKAEDKFHAKDHIATAIMLVIILALLFIVLIYKFI